MNGIPFLRVLSIARKVRASAYIRSDESATACSLFRVLSNEHESLAEMFRHQPALAAELVADLGVDVPRFADARLEPSDYADVTPTEWRSDGVVTLADEAGKRAMAIVVEVQRGRPTQKRWAWPVYLATTRARLNCRAALLVVCPDQVIAKQCAKPIETGHPGFVLRPLVLGPDRVPVVTDPEVAQRMPELAVLSALAHGRHRDIEHIVDALVQGLEVIEDAEHGRLYTDVVWRALPEAMRRHLEELMDVSAYEVKSDFLRGLEAKGKADAVLAFLAARGIDVPDDTREHITGCADPDQLDVWVRRAAVATSVDDLFD